MIKQMERTAVYGHWHDDPASQFKSAQVFHNEMVVDAQQFINYWHRCSLSSLFWSRYTAMFVPTAVASGWLNRSDVESALAYLLNELFENCAKFSSGPQLKVTYQSWIESQQMVFQLSNNVTPQNAKPFVAFISELLENDPDQLYFQKLEENIENDSSGSGLGFLTLINDYGVKFGYKFHSINAETVQVDVQAYLGLKEI